MASFIYKGIKRKDNMTFISLHLNINTDSLEGKRLLSQSHIILTDIHMPVDCKATISFSNTLVKLHEPKIG